MSNIHDKARSWINSQILSHGGCIERLTSINNDQVNQQAKQVQVGRMYEEMQIWRYIASVLDERTDMLNALVVLADVAESRGIPVDAARAAIARAKGRLAPAPE